MLRPRERVAACLRFRIAMSAGVEALQIPGRVLGALGGLQTCGSVWMCAVCGSKISERRREELAQGIEAGKAQGWWVPMNTYTLPHHSRQSLREVREGLQRSRERMCRQRSYRRLVDRLGIVGKVYALELTHGVNGWHPHIHEVMFCRGRMFPLELEWELRDLWLPALAAEGFPGGNQHAISSSETDGNVGEYLSKLDGTAQWTVAHELTKQTVKNGRGEHHRNPTALLSDWLQGDEAAGQLWGEYADEFKGRVQLQWSNGLRGRLGLAVEKSDEDLAAERREDASTVYVIDQVGWRNVLANDARYEVVVLAGQGDAAGIGELLRRLGE